jgi:hypothetical protein
MWNAILFFSHEFFFNVLQKLYIIDWVFAYYAHLATFRAQFYLDHQIVDPMVLSLETMGAPQLSHTNSRAACASMRPLPTLKDIMKKVMFYC